MDTDALFSCPLCCHILPDERTIFIQDAKPKTKFFKKGALVAVQGDPVDALYVLTKGSVKTEMISEAGNSLPIETITAPQLLAPAFLLAEEHFFPVDVIAIEDSEVVLISKSMIIKQLSCNEAFLHAYMKLNSNRMHFITERLKLFSIKTIKGKLAQYMLERSKNRHFVMDKNQTQLAEYFGVARPSLSRSLSEMIDDKVIILNNKDGEILNLDALKEYMLQ
ncbi:MAG: Crp/Fnr family transcriptional regulator [Bacteroidales bacterium]|jgi:CRP-like cAMP-binding protein|nr:Crp/Fnr family transcriptional regulator [Bacteroidales bacterium]